MASVTRLMIIKFLELVLVCIIIGLHYNHGVESSVSRNFLITGTYGGYLIILIGLFAGAVMGTPVQRRIDLFFSLVGVVLFIFAGALAFNSGESATVKGVLSIIEGVLFLVDAVLTFRGEA